MEHHHEDHNNTPEKELEHNGHHDRSEMDHAKHTKHTNIAMSADQQMTMNHENHSEHRGHSMEMGLDGHTGHGSHGVDHSGHEQMFRQRFWVSLILSIPVLLYSPSIQGWLNFSMPVFTGSQWVAPLFGVIVFVYGGLPFLQMAVPEVKNRKPGMMVLISLAISVAFIYSLAAFIFSLGSTFFWELVSLIDIMLLGHWMEMRSVRHASGALNELVKLMPDTAERILPDGDTEEVPTTVLRKDDLVLVRPGASLPADGRVEQGVSEVNEAMITGESKPIKKGGGADVIAGTINGDGSLRVKVTATGDETALAGIMRLV